MGTHIIRSHVELLEARADLAECDGTVVVLVQLKDMECEMQNGGSVRHPSALVNLAEGLAHHFLRIRAKQEWDHAEQTPNGDANHASRHQV